MYSDDEIDKYANEIHVVRASLRQYDQLYTLPVNGGVAPLDIIGEMEKLPPIEPIEQLLDPKHATIRQLSVDFFLLDCLKIGFRRRISCYGSRLGESSNSL